jgi:hypothetical protein
MLSVNANSLRRMQLTIRSIVKGAGTWLPFVSTFANSNTGGTISARYCYTVWMRHLCSATESIGVKRPRCVAELGPGDSLGIGLTAMLCGADHYYALDRKAFAIPEKNLAILDELLQLLRDRASIPNDDEFPGVFPKLANYSFPTTVLDHAWLSRCLARQRVEAIKRAIAEEMSSKEGIALRYFAPWDDNTTILPESVDWAFSQAALEHVDDVEAAYINLMKWLRPSGIMSHAIDYTCHGLTRDWNGHWTVSDGMWRIAHGKRMYLINRYPHSAHLRIIRSCGFHVVKELIARGEILDRTTVAPRFRQLTDLDLSTKSAFIVALKP